MNRFFLTLSCLLAWEVAGWAQNTPTAPTAAAGAASTTSTASRDLARGLSAAFADVYEEVSPGVVVIEAQPADEPDAGYPLASPLAQFFLPGPDPRTEPQQANQGSGFIMTPDGYILTNNHVLEGASPESVRVTLKDGRRFDAQVIGVDPVSDLAVLKVEAANLPVVELGDSDKTRVGEFAFALGAPFDLRYSFTSGIVSAKSRTDITGSQNYEEYLQTDASINPGNSGGPLVDIEGRVIGVNTLIRDLNRGLGFAIPINIAKKIATQLIAEGRAVRPWLGIWIKSVDEIPQLKARFPDLPPGILVLGIQNGTPAALSALRQNDIITSVDGTKVASARELQKVILDKEVDQEVELEVWRNQRIVKVKLRTAEHTNGLMPVANSRLLPSPSSPPPAAPHVSPHVPRNPAPAPGPSAPPAVPRVPASPSAGLTVKTLSADMAIAMKLPAEEGVLVTSVQPGSVAAAAGVKVGDVITSVGDNAVRTRDDLLDALEEAAGEAVMLNINRGAEKTYEILKL